MSSEGTQEWVITLTDDALADIDAVVSALETAGLRIDSVLRSTGHITGTCADAGNRRFSEISGVSSALPSAQYRIQ